MPAARRARSRSKCARSAPSSSVTTPQPGSTNKPLRPSAEAEQQDLPRREEEAHAQAELIRAAGRRTGRAQRQREAQERAEREAEEARAREAAALAAAAKPAAAADDQGAPPRRQPKHAPAPAVAAAVPDARRSQGCASSRPRPSKPKTSSDKPIWTAAARSPRPKPPRSAR